MTYSRQEKKRSELPVITDTEALPLLYNKWFAEIFPAGLPREENATCASCAMCESEGSDLDATRNFEPSVKCCTYSPDLPNFLVGSILNDSERRDTSARDFLLSRILNGVCVTPRGVGARPSRRMAYEFDTKAVFGRADSLRCEFYSDAIAGGGCGIWRSRNSVCSTWFCKHNRGKVGKKFWDDAKVFLMEIESELSLWCILQLAEESAAIRNMMRPMTSDSLAQELTAKPNDESRGALWTDWTGKEEDFFIASFQLVDKLTLKQVTEICGAHVACQLQCLRQSYESLFDFGIADRLKVTAPVSSHGTHSTPSRLLSTYSAFDPLNVLPEVLTILPYFDGRETRVVKEQLNSSLDIEVSNELLLKLVDFGILHAT